MIGEPPLGEVSAGCARSGTWPHTNLAAAIRIDGILLGLLLLLQQAAASTFRALSLFLYWLRSSWHSTTMPVGRWVTRMALEVLLMCWPPAPEENGMY